MYSLLNVLFALSSGRAIDTRLTTHLSEVPVDDGIDECYKKCIHFFIWIVKLIKKEGDSS